MVTAIPTVQEARRRIPLLIVNSTLHIGGAEQVASLIAQHADARIFEVAACYLKEPGTIADQMRQAGVELIQIPGFRPGQRDYLTSVKLRHLIRSRRVRIIHTHDIHGMIDGAMCRMTTHGLRHVHTFHFGNYPHRRLRHKAIEGALWRVPDVLVAVGHTQAESIRRCYRIPPARLRVIRNGVEDPCLWTASDALPRLAPPDVPVIASISTLISQKGLEFLLTAAAVLRDSGERFQLLIAGEGVLREPLRRLADELQLGEHVQFLGWVPDASHKVLPSCDIFVQSSLWEAMSVVVLEAMAAGKPVVVTSVGENPFVVANERTGLTVAPGDSAALAQSLQRLLRDPELRRTLGQAARVRYAETFTVQHMIAAYESVYRDLA